MHVLKDSLAQEHIAQSHRTCILICIRCQPIAVKFRSNLVGLWSLYSPFALILQNPAVCTGSQGELTLQCVLAYSYNMLF